MQGFQLIMNFLVMPIFFLSGALFPLTNLPAGARDRHPARSAGLRRGRLAGGAASAPRISAAPLDVAVLLVVAIAFLALGARQFSRIQI